MTALSQVISQTGDKDLKRPAIAACDSNFVCLINFSGIKIKLDPSKNR